MKNALLVLFCLISTIGFSQNYQCLQYGPKNYFTNGYGYLRGIRIDSVTTSGTDTYYYPYHTARTSHYAGIPSGQIIDTNGGSWLGKKVIQLADGTFLFDNIWHDTTVIKTQANVGDSWVFFNDTTSVYYVASVTSLDTMTVLGVLDTIKTITITADSGGASWPVDPVNNFQIKLSKNNGFVQVFDLYTFPYHMPDSFSTICQFDFYLDQLLGNTGWCDIGPCLSILPDTINSVFHLIPFHNPTKMEIFDFAAGDIYETEYFEDHPISPYSITDSTVNWISTRFGTPYNVTYTGIDTMHQVVFSLSGMMTPEYQNYFTYPSGGAVYDTTLLIDPGKMPEERGSYFFYHYYPNYFIYDSSGCYTGGGYVLDVEGMDANGVVAFTSDGEGWEGVSNYSTTYAIGYGVTNITGYSISNHVTTTQQYYYIYKNGAACYGGYRAIIDRVDGVSPTIRKIDILPNPANDQFTLKSENYNQSHTITITNTFGQLVAQITTDKNEELISTTDYPPGLYYVTVTDKSGGRLTRKLSVVH